MSDKYMTDRQFDDKIREMLAEPQEHLPAGLWDGIEARLDAVGTGGGRLLSCRGAVLSPVWLPQPRQWRSCLSVGIISF